MSTPTAGTGIYNYSLPSFINNITSNTDGTVVILVGSTYYFGFIQPSNVNNNISLYVGNNAFAYTPQSSTFLPMQSGINVSIDAHILLV